MRTWACRRLAIAVQVAAAALLSLPSFGADAARLVLGNDHLRLEFEREHLGLAALVDERSGVDHVHGVTGPSQSLWSLAFKPAPAEAAVTTVSGADAPCSSVDVQERDGARVATLAWTGMGVGTEAGVLDVTVTVTLPADSGLAEWRIAARNRSTRWGVWEVEFPVLPGLLAPGEYDVAAPTVNLGHLYRKLTGPVSLPYPHGYSGVMQFLCATKGGNSVYFAAHDPHAATKSLQCTPGELLSIRTQPENMGMPGTGYVAPFAAIVGVYQGDWLAGCKIYRQFAQQAPWTRQGRLVPQTDRPTLAEAALCMRVGDEPAAESHRLLLAAREYFGVPVSVHWYNWHSNPFDDGLPDYLPAKPGYAEAWKDLAGKGFLVMPYINGRLASVTAKRLKAYEPWLCRDAANALFPQPFGADMDHPVCPATELWQGEIAGICAGIAALGANAVYLDQVSGEPPVLCFAPGHGHPLGGGGWWVSGYQAMFARGKREAQRDGRQMQLTGEFPAEPYMGGLDGFLVWTTRLGGTIPMLAAVYSGYTSYFGTNTFFNYTDRAWIMREGRDFLWGTQNGWIHPAPLLDPANAVKAGFLKQVGKIRVAGRKFLTYGELVGLIDHPTATVTEAWPSYDAGSVTLPAIQGSIWKAEDGSLGVFLVNYDDAEQAIDVAIDGARYGLAWSQNGRPRLARISTEGAREELQVPPGGTLSLHQTLAAREIRLLEIAK